MLYDGDAVIGVRTGDKESTRQEKQNRILNRESILRQKITVLVKACADRLQNK
jgi:hypothetical protein